MGTIFTGVMDTAAAKQLSHAYGTMAERVAAIAQEEGLGKRLAHGLCEFLEAEVAYCARHELCEEVSDRVSRHRRGRPRVREILSTEHKWDKSRQRQELLKRPERFSRTLGSTTTNTNK